MLAIPDQTNPKAVHGKVSVPCLRGKRNPITAGHKLNWIRSPKEGSEQQRHLRIIEHVTTIFFMLEAMQIINNSIFSCY